MDHPVLKYAFSSQVVSRPHPPHQPPSPKGSKEGETESEPESGYRPFLCCVMFLRPIWQTGPQRGILGRCLQYSERNEKGGDLLLLGDLKEDLGKDRRKHGTQIWTVFPNTVISVIDVDTSAFL